MKFVSENNSEVYGVCFIILILCLNRIHPVNTCSVIQECTCYSDIFICYANTLTEVPSPLPESTRAIFLNQTGISRLRVQDFVGLPYLLELNLCCNNLAVIADGAFLTLSNLKFLHLERNNISIVRVGTLRGLRSLIGLFLGVSNIESIEDGSFDELLSLRWLDLGENRLKRLNGNSFRGLANLEGLYMAFNDIEEISNEMFGALSSLRELNMNHNKLRNLNENTFLGLEQLRILQFYRNEIDQIERGTFVDVMPNLQELYLAENRLTELYAITFSLVNLSILDLGGNGVAFIGYGTFNMLPNLKFLLLRYNMIESIHVDAFQGLRHLETLSLKSNRLSTLPDGLFDDAEVLVTLELSGNPWRCNCDLKWLIQYTKFADTITTCATPPEVAGELISKLAVSNLSCSDDEVLHSGPTTEKSALPVTSFNYTTLTQPPSTIRIKSETTTPPPSTHTTKVDPIYVAFGCLLVIVILLILFIIIKYTYAKISKTKSKRKNNLREPDSKIASNLAKEDDSHARIGQDKVADGDGSNLSIEIREMAGSRRDGGRFVGGYVTYVKPGPSAYATKIYGVNSGYCRTIFEQ